MLPPHAVSPAEVNPRQNPPPKKPNIFKHFITELFKRRTDSTPSAATATLVNEGKSETNETKQTQGGRKVRVQSLTLPKNTDVIALHEMQNAGPRAPDKRRLSLAVRGEVNSEIPGHLHELALQLDALSLSRTNSSVSSSSRSTPKSASSTGSSPKSLSSSSKGSTFSLDSRTNSSTFKLDTERSGGSEVSSVPETPLGSYLSFSPQGEAQGRCREKLRHIHQVLEEPENSSSLSSLKRHRGNHVLICSENDRLEWKETAILRGHSSSKKKALRFVLSTVEEACALGMTAFETAPDRSLPVFDLMTRTLENKRVQKLLARRSCREIRSSWIKLHLRNYFAHPLKEIASFKTILEKTRAETDLIIDALSDFQSVEIARIKQQYLKEKDLSQKTLGWIPRDHILEMKDRLLLRSIYSDERFELFVLTLKNLIFNKPDQVVGITWDESSVPFLDFFAQCTKNCKQFEEDAAALSKEEPSFHELPLEHFLKRSKQLGDFLREQGSELFKAHSYSGCIKVVAPQLDRLISAPRQGIFLMFEQMGIRGIDLLELRGLRSSEARKLREQLRRAAASRHAEALVECIKVIGRKMAGFPRAEAGLHASVDLFIALKGLPNQSPMAAICTFLDTSGLFSQRHSALAKLIPGEPLPIAEDKRRVLEAFIEIIGDNLLKPHPAFPALMEYMLTFAEEHAKELSLDSAQLQGLLKLIKKSPDEFPWDHCKKYLSPSAAAIP